MKKFTKNISFCLAAAVIVLFICSAILPISGTKIYSSVIRLHVIANSNSDSDQAVKLLVRDNILSQATHIFEGESIDTARLLAQENTQKLQQIARDTLIQNGFDYDVKVMLVVENYPTREYDGISFPAGDYLSLKVVLGEGDGENWWCVLFPPLCVGSSVMRQNLGSQLDNDVKIVASKKPVYRFKFKILEWFGKE